jgi:tRNA (guanine37-N1)-methyltransferase
VTEEIEGPERPGQALRVDVLALFPGIFEGALRESLLGKAIASGLVDVRVHDIRDHAHDKHRQVDDYGFGGGPGMVMKPEPIFEAVESLGGEPKRILLLSPAGRRFDQAMARELAAERRFVLICGRYEGVDERAVEGLSAEEVSIGDFVLAGGEVAALVVLEAVTRLVPGVVGNEESLGDESFERGLLDYPHYTRPRSFRGMDVPPVLLSGDHATIERWRREAALQKTRRNRPDLLAGGPSEGRNEPDEQGERSKGGGEGQA